MRAGVRWPERLRVKGEGAVKGGGETPRWTSGLQVEKDLREASLAPSSAARRPHLADSLRDLLRPSCSLDVLPRSGPRRARGRLGWPCRSVSRLVERASRSALRA